MKFTPEGKAVYNYSELLETAQKIALEEIQYELFYQAAESIDVNYYFDPKIELLNKKGFRNINFYRFVIEEEFIKIDFTFEYPINQNTLHTFQKFATDSNHYIPISLKNRIKSNTLIIEVFSNQSNYENNLRNIEVQYASDIKDTDLKEYIPQLKKLFENYYDFTVSRLYQKILKYLEDSTNYTKTLSCIKSYKFYFNGQLYEE